MPATASGISRTGRMASERWACMPSLPAGVTAKPARVRQPRPDTAVPPRRRFRQLAVPGRHADGFDCDLPCGRKFDAGQPLELFGQDVGLEAALARQRNVAEFGAADGRVPVRPGARGIGEVPEMRHPVRGGLQDLHHIGAPEFGGRAVVGEPDADLLAGNAVADEDDASLVPGHAVPAVGDGSDVDDEIGVGVRPGVGGHWISCSFLASSDDFSCHGTLPP